MPDRSTMLIEEQRRAKQDEPPPSDAPARFRRAGHRDTAWLPLFRNDRQRFPPDRESGETRELFQAVCPDNHTLSHADWRIGRSADSGHLPDGFSIIYASITRDDSGHPFRVGHGLGIVSPGIFAPWNNRTSIKCLQFGNYIGANCTVIGRASRHFLYTGNLTF